MVLKDLDVTSSTKENFSEDLICKHKKVQFSLVLDFKYFFCKNKYAVLDILCTNRTDSRVIWTRISEDIHHFEKPPANYEKIVQNSAIKKKMHNFRFLNCGFVDFIGRILIYPAEYRPIGHIFGKYTYQSPFT